MADIDSHTIEYLSRLSRIECSEEEKEKLLKNLADVLKYVSLLEEVNTENVEPCNHVLENMNNVLREDDVGTILPRELFLANAPAHVGGMIRVPTVLKNS